MFEYVFPFGVVGGASVVVRMAGWTRFVVSEQFAHCGCVLVVAGVGLWLPSDFGSEVVIVSHLSLSRSTWVRMVEILGRHGSTSVF